MLGALHALLGEVCVKRKRRPCSLINETKGVNSVSTGQGRLQIETKAKLDSTVQPPLCFFTAELNEKTKGVGTQTFRK